MQSPTTTHSQATKRVIRYVRVTLTHGVHLSHGPLTLFAFTDADWVEDPFDKKSTTSFLVFLGSNPISWSSMKQTTVSKSSTEAECHALATTIVKLSWLKTLFRELHLFLHHILVFWCDNVFAIAFASNPVFYTRAKHVEVDYHFVREIVLHRDLCVQFVSSKDNLANVFTKPLAAPLSLLFKDKLMACSSPIHLKGDVENDQVNDTIKR